MNRLVVLSLTFTFLIIVILPLSLTVFIKVIPGGIQPSLGNTEKIYGDIVLSQAFISPEDNLTGIGVSIKNPNFANKKKTTINIYNDSNKIVRTIILDGQNIADGKFVKILFESIRDSKNNKFVWSISSPESNFNDALQIFLTDQQTDWSLDLKINERLSNQTLSYVTLHKPLNLTTVLFRVMNELINKIKGDGIFFAGYSFLIILLVVFLFRRKIVASLPVILRIIVLRFISSRSLPTNLKKPS